MKINELVQTFEIWMSNEEKTLLEQIDGPVPLASFTDREQVIIRNLHRKSLISKIPSNGLTFVVRNG